MTSLLETERLIIRRWIPEIDAEQAFAIYGDAQVMRFIGTGKTEASIETQRRSLEAAIERYKQSNNTATGAWAIVEKESKIVVGTILLKQLPDTKSKPTQDYEVGWHLRKASWGKGYATEAAREIINYGFNFLQLSEIYAVVKPENHASVKVTQRLGMTPLGITNRYYGGIELLLFKLDSQEIKSKMRFNN
ncbi:acetyltransferase, ribosomal protein N-acetylase [Rivularia sp. PCC 7116]|uniref:GNAT family N-acetyltransferase n=1 Tax=Rivularia sp. PCC 7116 TaxID=373994 RepID=UPI00029F4C8C|nr:GNAT family N-acetyltransferase [Rivularia sp. PCC 7116]AFY57096.1 acetyltransferase, ribosomal protein N-acetylase [Rivularia sp. PCC 7116]